MWELNGPFMIFIWSLFAFLQLDSPIPHSLSLKLLFHWTTQRWVNIMTITELYLSSLLCFYIELTEPKRSLLLLTTVVFVRSIAAVIVSITAPAQGDALVVITAEITRRLTGQLLCKHNTDGRTHAHTHTHTHTHTHARARTHARTHARMHAHTHTPHTHHTHTHTHTHTKQTHTHARTHTHTQANIKQSGSEEKDTQTSVSVSLTWNTSILETYLTPNSMCFNKEMLLTMKRGDERRKLRKKRGDEDRWDDKRTEGEKTKWDVMRRKGKGKE